MNTNKFERLIELRDLLDNRPEGFIFTADFLKYFWLVCAALTAVMDYLIDERSVK